MKIYHIINRPRDRNAGMNTNIQNIAPRQDRVYL